MLPLTRARRPVVGASRGARTVMSSVTSRVLKVAPSAGDCTVISGGTLSSMAGGALAAVATVPGAGWVALGGAAGRLAARSASRTALSRSALASTRAITSGRNRVVRRREPAKKSAECEAPRGTCHPSGSSPPGLAGSVALGRPDHPALAIGVRQQAHNSAPSRLRNQRTVPSPGRQHPAAVARHVDLPGRAGAGTRQSSVPSLR